MSSTLIREDADSTALQGLGYSQRRACLYVQFRTSQRIYRYANVPKHLVSKLFAVSSAGACFAETIRNAYEFELVELSWQEVLTELRSENHFAYWYAGCNEAPLESLMLMKALG